jgi:RNA polymerase sigma-70 factor (ECF subfamily)
VTFCVAIPNGTVTASVCLISGLGGIIMIGKIIHEQKMPQKSMISLMKKSGIDAAEDARAESSAARFEALFMEHWAHVYRVLYRLVGDPAEAEDLALETFLRLYRSYPFPPAPEKGFNMGGWLHRVATNLGLHSIRGFKRRERYELAAGKDPFAEAPEARPAEILAQKEERRLVRLTLARMNQRQAQLLVLRYSGMAYKDIAQELDLSPASIGPLLLRAEREFEKRYREMETEGT